MSPLLLSALLQVGALHVTPQEPARVHDSADAGTSGHDSKKKPKKDRVKDRDEKKEEELF